MQDLHKQLSVAQNFSKQLNASGMSEESAIGGMFAGYGGLGISSFTTGAMLGGGLTMGGLEDWLDASDLAREEKKAVRAELQKSIDENLEALRKITNSLFAAKFVADLTRSMFPLNVQKMMEVFNNYYNKDGSK
ncbi:hypothetical protein HpHA137_09510 [Helicobacter pylori]